MSDEIKVQAKNKKTKLFIVIAAVAVAVITIVAVALSVSKSASAKKVEEQLSLGAKYLSELDYEQAIAAYELAIEIDPKCEDAYLALAEIYIETGEFDKAAEILDKADEQFMSKAIWEKQQEIEEATEKQSMVIATPMPLVKPTETVTITSTPTPAPTVTPNETPTTVPLPTPSIILQPTEAPKPTPTEELTPTATPRPTNTPTPAPTATTAAVAELKRVELKMESDCFTYERKDYEWVCTGLSEKGYKEFREYDKTYCVSIVLPAVSDQGDEVEGFYSKSNGGYDLKELLTETSAYVELVCPETYTIYYGVCDERPNPKYADKLMNIVLNEGMEEIGNSAFNNCSGLESVIIPESVVKIGYSAFSNCIGLREIVLPDSVSEYGGNAFLGCKNLQIDEVEMKGKIFGTQVFSGVTIEKVVLSGKTEAKYDGLGIAVGVWTGANVEKIEIVEGVEEISAYAFACCPSVKEVALPISVKTIGQGAFRECTGLENVVIPESVEKIGYGAFSGCTELREIELPENVLEYGGNAFLGCKNLQIDEVEMKGKIFGTQVFSGVTIEKVVLSGKTEAKYDGLGIASGVWTGANVEKIEIVEGVEEISAYAFACCSSVKEVVIPTSVKKIGIGAFCKCTKLEDLIIPTSVEAIGSSAFSGCEEVTLTVTPGSIADTYAKENNIPVKYQ